MASDGSSSFCGPRAPWKAERDGVVVRLWDEEVSHRHWVFGPSVSLREMGENGGDYDHHVGQTRIVANSGAESRGVSQPFPV